MKNILKDDDSGQFILLMSVIVAIGLVIILIFFNQSMMAGHSSAQSIMDFPKDDIRDFKTKTTTEAISLGNSANAGILSSKDDNTNAFYSRFNNSLDSYIVQVQNIYARNGVNVNAKYYDANFTSVGAPGNKTLHPCDQMNITITYDNGETYYNSTSTIYFN